LFLFSGIKEDIVCERDVFYKEPLRLAHQLNRSGKISDYRVIINADVFGASPFHGSDSHKGMIVNGSAVGDIMMDFYIRNGTVPGPYSDPESAGVLEIVMADFYIAQSGFNVYILTGCSSSVPWCFRLLIHPLYFYRQFFAGPFLLNYGTVMNLK